MFEKVVVSTDDEEIATVAREYGAQVPFMRPKSLADDYTGIGPVVEHSLNALKALGEEYDFVCTIYATAPLLEARYLLQAFELLKNSNASSVFAAASMPSPIQRSFKINKDGRCEMFWPENFLKRSQDLEPAYHDAGQFSWSNLSVKSTTQGFGKDMIPLVLPRYLVQDIDTPEDWEMAEMAYAFLHHSTGKSLGENDLS